MIARLAYVVFVLLFWFLNNSLIGLVAKISQFTIWLYSSAIIVILTLGASITDYVMNRGKSKLDTVRTARKSRQSQKIFHTVSIRTLVFASPFMILGGILLIYVGLVYQEFRALYFGGFLIFLTIGAPIIRMWEDHLRRARRKEAELI